MATTGECVDFHVVKQEGIADPGKQGEFGEPTASVSTERLAQGEADHARLKEMEFIDYEDYVKLKKMHELKIAKQREIKKMHELKVVKQHEIKIEKKSESPAKNLSSIHVVKCVKIIAPHESQTTHGANVMKQSQVIDISNLVRQPQSPAVNMNNFTQLLKITDMTKQPQFINILPEMLQPHQAINVSQTGLPRVLNVPDIGKQPNTFQFSKLVKHTPDNQV